MAIVVVVGIAVAVWLQCCCLISAAVFSLMAQGWYEENNPCGNLDMMSASCSLLPWCNQELSVCLGLHASFSTFSTWVVLLYCSILGYSLFAGLSAFAVLPQGGWGRYSCKHHVHM